MHGYERSYYPTFVFTDAEGREHSVESRFGQNPPQYKVGDTAPVFYPRSDPECARLGTRLDMWLWAFINGVACLVLVAAGGLTMFFTRSVSPPVVSSTRPQV